MGGVLQAVILLFCLTRYIWYKLCNEGNYDVPLSNYKLLNF